VNSFFDNCFVSVSIFTGCSLQSRTETKTISYGDLISELSKNGLEVDGRIQPIDSIGIPLFSAKPKTISVYLNDANEEIYVYSFESNRISDSEMKKVSKQSNNVGELYIEGERHFYKRANLIVAYLGKNKAILDSLEKTIGKAFASSRYSS
jgi:hypothetical protein